MRTQLLTLFVACLAAGLLLAPARAESPKNLLPHPALLADPEIAQRLSGALLTVALAPARLRTRQIEQLVAAGRLRLIDGRLETEILPADGQKQAALEAVAAVDGVCRTGQAPEAARLSCLLPPDRLLDLARRDSLALVEPPDYPTPQPQPAPQALPQTYEQSATAPPQDDQASLVLTEGLIATHALDWIRKGITGKGVKVGVIDEGFEDYPDRQADGNLPAILTVRNFVAGEAQSEVDGTTKHGTACAEIIRDLAPGAALYLAKVQKPGEVGLAFDWLRDQGVDIISASIGFHGTDPGDGSGYFPGLVDAAEAADILWVNGAGNERRLHYNGTLDPINIVWSGYNLTVHRFAQPLGWLNVYGESSDDTEAVGPFTILSASLRWSDWGAPTTDLDLYLARWDPDALGPGQGSWRVVAESIRPQTGLSSQTPVEEIDYVTVADATKYGYFVRSYDGAAPVNVELFSIRDSNTRLAYMENARSLNNMAVAANVVAVGASDINAGAPNDYSSEGPTNGPGGQSEGGYLKPDLCGYARVSTVSYGPQAFTGTSAATPHAAGAAALVREKYPDWSASRVRDFLYDEAINIGDPGPDARCGHGLLSLGLPPSETAAAWFFLLLLDQVEP